jgi:hypothetical protein
MMLVAEGEAKEKFCYRSRCARERTALDLFCIGRKCMAWRWWDEEPTGAEGSTRRRGYCGLAGKPTVE